MPPLPEDAAEQVRIMRAVEQDVLAAVDRMGSGAATGGTLALGGRKSSGSMTVAERANDPATVARTGMSRLRRELQELEAIAEEQPRPADRELTLHALAERAASLDALRQILRDATLAANRVAHEREDDARAELGLGGASRDGEKATPPANEASTVSLAQDATAGLRRTRAMMAEELEKGQRTLAAMSESRAQLRKTGDEYGGSQRAAVGAGGKLLTTLERQVVTSRLVLWLGFACFMLAVFHVVLKRTPLLVRFHPLYYIRHATARKATEAAKLEGGGSAGGEGGGGGERTGKAATIAQAALTATLGGLIDADAAAAMVDYGGTTGAGGMLDADPRGDGGPVLDVEVGDYMKVGAGGHEL
mmetsp:Transcript_7942/g.19705  ORF Transcript_7942/g.19705 Transcript_7942/m.19705 type:complete len:361 (-) Transcript_7942:82-1164(-)|eukprot:CAMPEP_0181368010 /NCGR_PEP_ID=MMETSP1106-20121128/11810_1 /TAXON_ID=81844 /ORGANISM="Mantoniella antarctica, Strain SL-175" /LENGTH=360 /DNA_ID=CAMNT_0023483999 /DNA_START=44 /DNA_END=1126 /DNA_ORIENTATION=-